MFYKGQHIVLTKHPNTQNIGNGFDQFALNIVYEISENADEVHVYEDAEGEPYNSWCMLPFDKQYGNDWRYATQEEITLYQQAGKPVKINHTMNQIPGISDVMISLKDQKDSTGFHKAARGYMNKVARIDHGGPAEVKFSFSNQKGFYKSGPIWRVANKEETLYYMQNANPPHGVKFPLDKMEDKIDETPFAEVIPAAQRMYKITRQGIKQVAV